MALDLMTGTDNTQMVPHTQDLPLICPVEADEQASFTTIAVPLPPGLQPVPVSFNAQEMCSSSTAKLSTAAFPTQPQIVFSHWSAHYIEGHAQQVAALIYRCCTWMDVSSRILRPAPMAGECGVWVDRDGSHLVDINQIYKVGYPRYVATVAAVVSTITITSPPAKLETADRAVQKQAISMEMIRNTCQGYYPNHRRGVGYRAGRP
ncbi:MAG: hypothetical protein R2867_11565 [Caldilineaceae bacterium]